MERGRKVKVACSVFDVVSMQSARTPVAFLFAFFNQEKRRCVLRAFLGTKNVEIDLASLLSMINRAHLVAKITVFEKRGGESWQAFYISSVNGY